MSILLVDDDAKLLSSLHRSVARLTGGQVTCADNAAEALALIKARPFKLVISDVKMPEMDGVALLKAITALRQPPAVVMLTAYGSIDLAVDCLKRGAYDFLTKPVEMERLARLIRNALGAAEPEKSLCDMIGASQAMRAAFSQIRSYATTDSTVLVTGESGTGKELAAQAIHSLSPRRERKIVFVNCPAIPESVLESELFGHARGAFTNAVADRRGLFEEAEGGTIVLDEIGDLPRPLQAKLLRVLEDKEIRPLGSNRTRRVDARCLALTNRDLRASVQTREFRADLYHRLNVLHLALPPLRERPEDIAALTAHFLATFSAKFGRAPLALGQGTLEMLAGYPWPGNVRELRNAVERSLLLATGPALEPHDVRLEQDEESPGPAAALSGQFEVVPYRKAKNDLLEDFSRTYFASVLELSAGNVTVAAQKCGLKRQQLQWAINHYGLRHP